jgi:hypothetical protein
VIWSVIKESWIGRALAAAAGLSLIVLGSYWRGRIDGQELEASENEKADADRADDVRDRADAARDRVAVDGRDPDDRLREQGRLRD